MRQVVQVIFGIATAADDGGLDLGCWIVGEVCAAAGARGPGEPAALALVAAAAGGEDVWEEFGEEGACAGKAGADYGHVAFYRGPGGGADVVVCLYRGVVSWLVWG